jgi:DNA-binding MarR family transcriptional regulator
VVLITGGFLHYLEPSLDAFKRKDAVSGTSRRSLEAQGVSVAEWVVLRALFDEDAVAPSQLAVRLGITRGSVSKLIDRLAAKSPVRKTPSTRDRRYQAVALTAAGRTLVPTLAVLADENDRAIDLGRNGESYLEVFPAP